MAERYPMAEVIAFDISPVQPKYKPDNVKFIVHDAEQPFPFPKGYFDYIHMSLLHGSIKNWTELVTKIKTHLKVGGALECQELAIADISSDDGTVKPEQAYPRWGKLMEQAGIKSGRHISNGPKLVGHLQDAGFGSIDETIYKSPMGLYGETELLKKIGALNRTNVLSGIEGFTTRAFTYSLGWKKEDIDKFLDEVRADIKNPDIHSYVKL
jgi:Methyltransferase domain